MENKEARLKAAFLGPHSENYDILEELIIEALRDHFYWRRNFHPEDTPAITQKDKIDPMFLDSTAKLRQELFNILSELKKGVPFYSLRYLGHINSDLLIAAIVGYFSAMLYNQNNVVAESSPITIEKELEYIDALARMVGFNEVNREILKSDKQENSAWGHLCSGGTTANIEAMWVARNVKFYPLSVLLAIRKPELITINEKGLINQDLQEMIKNLAKLKIKQPNGGEKKIVELTPFELLSLKPSESLGLRRKIREYFHNEFKDDGKNFKKFEDKLPTIRKLGIMKFLNECHSCDPKIEFNLPVIIVPLSRHYCWPKLADILGLGQECLKNIELDNNFRLDIKQLEGQIKKLSKENIPVLCLMSVCGSTEEGAIDPLKEIVDLREMYEKENISFWLHSDAAFGGFFASIESNETYKKPNGIISLKDLDSIVIDPHKLGYVPYPAGAVLFNDSRVREHISFEAPYLSDNIDVTKAFWGKWTLEGSRPGAAAISCYLAQHCFPLNNNGYGAILKECLLATKKLSEAFDSIGNADFTKNYGFEIKKLYEPELNVLCYVVTSPRYIKDPLSLNQLTEKLWKKMTVSVEKPLNLYQFFVSKTEYTYRDYKDQINKLLKSCNINNEPDENYNLMVLRTVLMHPLANDNPDILEEFTKYLCVTAYDLLPEIQIDIIKNKFARREGHRRMKVLIIEDIQNESDTLKRNLELEFEVSRGLDIAVASTLEQVKKLFIEFQPDAMVVDLNLTNEPNDYQGMKILEWVKSQKNNDNKAMENYLGSVVYSAYLNPIVKSALEYLDITEDRMISKVKSIDDTLVNSKENSREVLNALLSLI